MKTTNANKKKSLGEWILDHRPDEELLNFLLLPLAFGAMINTVTLAMFLSDCGTFGSILSWILIIIVAIAYYGIYYELFGDDAELFSLQSIWAFMKFTFAMTLSGICYLITFGFITKFAVHDLMGTPHGGSYSVDSVSALGGILLLLGLTALTLYSIYAFKSDDPRAASRAATLLLAAMAANFLCFVISH